MSNSLANPRRTRLKTWPKPGSEKRDQERRATPTDSAPDTSGEQGDGA